MKETVASSRFRRGLRLVGWNALLLVLGTALIAMAGEAWLRLTMPFMTSSHSWQFVSNVGPLRPPNTELRFTNQHDYWNVSRTNSLGFLDREPPSPERAAATCHISMIGDSFVEAKEVPIRDKFHVRLEELAADELPHLDITTSAFGFRDTGQVQQLPFYDEYARLLHPKLIVLVFVVNDFLNNAPSPVALSLRRRILASQRPSVRRRSDGKLELVLPQDPPLRSFGGGGQPSEAARAVEEAVNRSWLVLWLREKKKVWFPPDLGSRFIRNAEALRRQPGHAALRRIAAHHTARRNQGLRSKEPASRSEELSQYTRFALEQFRQRADQDGAKLVILASYTLPRRGPELFERLRKIAATLDIPVIDQADYILRQGAEIRDARWRHDYHWNPAGHRWAAEALLEYIEEHPAICDG